MSQVSSRNAIENNCEYEKFCDIIVDAVDKYSDDRKKRHLSTLTYDEIIFVLKATIYSMKEVQKIV